MRIDAIEVSTSKKDIIKYILNKMPLMSKISPFNLHIDDVHLEYIEIKVLNYEVISKEKNNKMIRKTVKKKDIIMLVNTYNGYSESVENIPTTISKYVTKSSIKKSKIEENAIIESVKSQMINFLIQNNNKDTDKINLQNINIKDVKSIYKPYWIARFKGRYILMDA